MSTETVREIPLEDVHPASDNLRTLMGDIKGLQASIEDEGIHEPLIVIKRVEEKGGYEIVAGHRRREAAKRVGLKTLPCLVREMSEQQRIQLMLVENLQREEISPVDEARGYFRLVESGMTVKDLAGKIGRSQKHVSGRLRLLDLPKGILKLVPDTISLEQAEDLRELVTSEEFVKHDEELGLTDLVIEVVADSGPRWATVRVRDMLLDHNKAQVRAKIEEVAAKRNMTLVEQEQKGYYGYGWPAGHAELSELGIDPKDHKGEPCHAIGLKPHRERHYQTVEICTKKSRHTSKNASSAVKPDNYDEMMAERELRKQEREYRKAQEQAAKDAIHDGIKAAKQSELTEVAILHLVEKGLQQSNKDRLQYLCEVLGCVPEVEDGKPSHADVEEALLEHASESKAGAVRVAAAIAISDRSWGHDNLAVQARREAIWQPHHTEPPIPGALVEQEAHRKAVIEEGRRRREEERVLREEQG